jgi:hypothetical protein
VTCNSANAGTFKASVLEISFCTVPFYDIASASAHQDPAVHLKDHRRGRDNSAFARQLLLDLSIDINASAISLLEGRTCRSRLEPHCTRMSRSSRFILVTSSIVSSPRLLSSPSYVFFTLLIIDYGSTKPFLCSLYPPFIVDSRRSSTFSIAAGLAQQASRFLSLPAELRGACVLRHHPNGEDYPILISSNADRFLAYHSLEAQRVFTIACSLSLHYFKLVDSYAMT